MYVAILPQMYLNLINLLPNFLVVVQARKYPVHDLTGDILT